MKPLQRAEAPDFERFLKVVRREGDRSYVPFFEMVMDINHLPPLTGLDMPEGMNFMPSSRTYEASFSWLLQSLAKMGFDHGTINICGFKGFPTKREGGFATAEGGVIGSWEDFENYAWPSAKDIDVEAMERTAKLAPEGMGVMTGNGAPFEQASLMLGITPMSMLMYDEPDLVEAIFEKIGSTLLEVYRTVAGLPFLRGIQVAGDMGHKSGTLIAPEKLRQWVLPWHKKFVEAIHAGGKIAILHSCGNLEAIWEDILDCGYDAKHSFEDAIDPGLFALHRRYGDRTCMRGGIDVDFLARAEEPAIRQRVRETIDRLAPGGGWCLGSGNSIPDYVPTENFRAMLDEGLTYGR